MGNLSKSVKIAIIIAVVILLVAIIFAIIIGVAGGSKKILEIYFPKKQSKK